MTSKKEKEPKKSKRQSKMKKRAVLLAYEKSLGNVSNACKSVGIARETFYRWLKEDPEFKEKADEVDEANLDFAETVLLKNIRDGKETSLIFFLKTKGKHRGYVEKIEQEVSVNPFFELMKKASNTDE